MTTPTIQITALDEFETELWEQSSIHSIIGRVMARPDAQTFKFDGDMVQASKPLWDWAEYVVDHYVGTWTLMVEFRTRQRTGTQLSKNQLAVALNSLLNVWRRSMKQVAARVAQDKLNDDVFGQRVDLTKVPTFRKEVIPDPEGGRPSIEPQDTIDAVKQETIDLAKNAAVLQSFEGFKAPQSGTYTFVDGSGEYRVLRFDEYQGSTFISYQNGPDNESSFAKFGKITPDHKLVIWAAAFYKQDKIKISNAQRAQLRDAVEFICSMDQDTHLKFGEAYALKSGRCFVCGRTLTVPSSISEGMGPICAGKWGM